LGLLAAITVGSMLARRSHVAPPEEAGVRT
jgi:hypothetical protein